AVDWRAHRELRQSPAQFGRKFAAGTVLEGDGDVRGDLGGLNLARRKDNAETQRARLRRGGQRARKFWRSCLPDWVRTDSGWNCTPSSLWRRWRTPMMMPSSVSAVIANSRGSDLRSTISE